MFRISWRYVYTAGRRIAGCEITPTNQLICNFAEFRQIRRNSPESRPCAAEPAGRRIRWSPKFLRAPWRYFYAMDRGIIWCEAPPCQTK